MIEVKIGGVDYTGKVINKTIQISQSNDGLNSTCSFDFFDEGVLQTGVWTVEQTHVETDGDRITDYTVFWPSNKVEVSVVEGAEVFFAGTIARVKADSQFEKNRILKCECNDFNQLVEELVIDSLEEYGAETDGDIIDDLFVKYGVGINFADHVVPSGYVFDEIAFENITLRQALDRIAAQSECIWYIDYSRKLHYATSEANAPGWHLSDKADNVNSFPYYTEISRECDAANMVNSLFVVGEVVGLWFEDAASVAEYGRHRAVINDTSLIDIDDMEAYADRVLNRYKDPEVVYVLKTEKIGLRAGMNVRLVNNLYAVDDTFLISSLNISFSVDEEVPIFTVTLGGSASSVSASAQRITLDQIHNSSGFTAPGQVLASRGWSHNLTFSATDDDTVAWTAGTIWTAAGPTFAINAGNTDDPGAMAGIVYVCLDTDVSITDLQIVVNAANAVGINRILVAVCAPNGDATKDAIFQVYGGGSADVGVFITADNVAVNTLTFNEIAGNTITAAEMNIGTLSSLTANMGTLTAGTIQTDVAGNDRVVINIADGIRGIDAANVVQFQLDPSDGKAYAGAGAVILDEDGVTIEAENLTDPLNISDPNALKFIYDDAGTPRRVGEVFGCYRSNGMDRGHVVIRASRAAGDPWSDYCGIILIADDDVAPLDVRFNISSNGTIDAVRCTTFQTDGDLKVDKGLVVGSKTDNPGDGYCRILRGLRVGTTGSDANDNDIWVDGDIRLGRGLRVGDLAAPINDTIEAVGDIFAGRGLHVGSLGGAAQDNDITCDGTIATSFGDNWNLGDYTAGGVAVDGFIDVQINGSSYRVACEAI